MEPEISPQASPEPEEKVTLTLAQIKSLVMDAVKEATAPLVAQNEQLQGEVVHARHRNIEGELASGDPSHMQFAKSVTLATRCVVENPGQYKNVVDPGGLSINNASPLSPKAVRECFEEPQP